VITRKVEEGTSARRLFFEKPQDVKKVSILQHLLKAYDAAIQI
jgi:hypothetical protein